MSSTSFVEEVDAIWWRNVIFVAAVIGSMVYVRLWYYPWLMAKKRDPVLPIHHAVALTESKAFMTPSHPHPLEISLI